MSTIIDRLDQLWQTRSDDIEAWFASRRRESPPFIYHSVDLRHSGCKLVPVDTNLFPAGFNNLSNAACRRAVTHFRHHLGAFHAKRILLIPENHTRNLSYLENLAVLQKLIELAGFEVRLGRLVSDPELPMQLDTPSGKKLSYSHLHRDGRQLTTDDGFVPDVIVMNNDLTSGEPALLHGLRQPVLPPPFMGWHQRQKSVHFLAYDQLVQHFCAQFSLDPWLLSTVFEKCGLIDFREQSGIDCVARNVEKVLEKIRRKYAEHGIADAPYVFVKADSGTYGMGIMTVHSGEELLEMNKKTRNKMKMIKEGTPNTEVIIQEGVPTIDQASGKTAEPMIYLVDGVPVGGAFRVHSERDAFSNLNTPGMEFTGMCDESEDEIRHVKVSGCNFRVYGLIAAIAALAAAREQYSDYSI